MWYKLLGFVQRDKTLNYVIGINGLLLVIMYLLILFVLPAADYFPAHINIFGEVDGYSIKEMKYVFPFIPVVLSFITKNVNSRFQIPTLTLSLLCLNLLILIYIFKLYL